MARNKYPQETVKAILDVSLKLFIEKGYEKTSVQDIVNHLGGLSKGAIYHHFKSKEKIFFAALEQIYAKQDADINTIIQDKALTGLEKLKSALLFSLLNPTQLDVFQTAPDFLSNPILLAEQIRSVFEFSAPKVIQPIIEQGIADGSIHTEYPKQMAEVIQILLNVWLVPTVFSADLKTMGERFDFLLELFKSLGMEVADNSIKKRFLLLCKLYNEKKTKAQ